MGKRDLLLDDEQDEQQPTIRVNEEYARRFEHNKRREELQRLQEKHPEVAARLAAKAAAEAAKAARQAAAGRGGHADEDESEEESSSDDDDDDEDLDADDDTDKVLETLVRLKKKDPVLKQPDVVLFPQPADSDEAAADGADGKKSKPVYLRTVLAKQALEGGPGSDEEDEGEAALPKQPVAHSYAAEQQELKKAFLQAAAEAEEGGAAADEGGVLRKKAGKRSAAEAGEDGPDKEQQVNQLLDEYFGKDNELDAAGAFLKSYIANKAWKEPTDGGGRKKRLKGLDGSSSSSEDEGDSSEGGSSDEEGGEGDINVEEDEEFLEEVDRFEAAYNFRFEEPGSHRIQSFPRVIEDSVRRPDERRKRQRDRKVARKQAEKEAREAEIRRMKNLKKQEIQDMFTRIQEEAGIKSKKGQADADLAEEDAAAALSKSGGLANLLDELLEGDFDPDAYDKRMAAAFDDEYYEGDDEHDELFGDADEELAAEDDVLKPAAVATLGNPSEAAGGFALLHQQLQQQQEGDGSDEEEAGEDAEGDKGAAAAARAEQRSQLQRKLEEYYKLDCEDNIGGIPCRFKYRQVPAETFGLSVEDILTLPDKELNQIIGMKKVAAPYRDDSKRLRPNYKALQRVKGEAAAAAAMRQQKRDKQKHKDAERQQRRQQEQQQQRDQAAQADAQQNGVQQQGRHKQQQGGKKRRFEQAHGRPHGQQQHKQHRQQQPSQQRQQQKPLAEMSAEEKQAARLASYAKLTLKPQQQEQHTNGADGMQHRQKKQKQSGDQEQQGQRKKQKKEKQPPPQGRLSAVPVDKPLTKAQKKNLLRSLKRKEKKGPE